MDKKSPKPIRSKQDILDLGKVDKLFKSNNEEDIRIAFELMKKFKMDCDSLLLRCIGWYIAPANIVEDYLVDNAEDIDCFEDYRIEKWK